MLLLVTVLGLTRAQESDLDDALLDPEAFDQSMTKSAAAEKVNQLMYLPALLFVHETSGYLADAGGYGSDSRFYGKISLKASRADIGALFIGYNYSYFLFAATDNTNLEQYYRFLKPDPLGVTTALSELHLSFDVHKRVFIRLGSQLMSWGASYFWSPEDFINTQRAQALVLSPVDARRGKPGVRVHIPVKSANIFLFTDFSGVTTNKSAHGFAETVAQAVRVDGTVNGVNLGIVGYVSKNRPVQLGCDATGNVFATDVYGELACGFTDGAKPTPTAALSAGASHLFGQERNWTGRVEGYYNDTGFTDTKMSRLLPGSFTPFYSGRYYAYGEIAGTALLGGTTAVALFGFINIADGSFSPTLQSTFDLPGVIPFTVFTRYYGGPLDREFTALFGGRVWQGGLRILVSL